MDTNLCALLANLFLDWLKILITSLLCLVPRLENEQGQQRKQHRDQQEQHAIKIPPKRQTHTHTSKSNIKHTCARVLLLGFHAWCSVHACMNTQEHAELADLW